MSKTYCIYASTHPGMVREVNEDNFVLNTLTKDVNEKYQNLKVSAAKEPVLCGVFDGMGGEKGGYQASMICADYATSYYKHLVKEKDTIANSIDKYVIRCTEGIRAFLEENHYKRGGSTFAMAYLCDGMMHLASMGDSRMYLLRDGYLFQISRDHTLANMKFEANIFTKKEAEESPESHVLIKYLGKNLEGNDPEMEIYNPIQLKPGDKLLICSDGLYDMCSDDEIAEVLNSPAKGYAVELVKRALKKGGIDNITCIVVENA